jgi:hypothetical protein
MNWKSWIHGAIIVTFLLNAVYCFGRCLTTDPLNDMIIRRFFAFDAEFSFACAPFYFLLMLFLQERSKKDIPKGVREFYPSSVFAESGAITINTKNMRKGASFQDGDCQEIWGQAVGLLDFDVNIILKSDKFSFRLTPLIHFEFSGHVKHCKSQGEEK